MNARLVLAGALAFAGTSLAAAPSALHGFVRVQGDQLVLDDQPFRFLSFNIPNLHLVEDHLAFEEGSPWRWPDAFEIADALDSVRQQGGTVVRTYVLSVIRTNDAPGTPRHVLAPGRFNEAGFRALDRVLQVAQERGIRVIIPFVDNWSWWGGIGEYSGFRGKPKNAFWTDPQVIADFKETIRFTVTRRNTITGIRYADDPAILCWETGNELESPPAWTREIATYIKQLDPHHPVMDGFHATELREESLAALEIDLVTTHHYPGGRKSFAELIRANWQHAQGRKPYVVGEFGFVDTTKMREAIDAVLETGTAGALAWSLRFRSRDGGFYWHSEPAGGDHYKAFHWPGFGSGADYDELGFMSLMRQKAFEIRGLPLPPVEAPAAPRLLPVRNLPLLSWQGSAGATSYSVERAPRRSGPWTVIAEGVDETRAPYRPSFADTTAAQGRWFYRVRAANSDGTSAPSNVSDPVSVRARLLVDELADVSLMDSHAGLEPRKNDSRKAKEDYHRFLGRPGSFMVYRLDGAVQSCRLDAFFPGPARAFTFEISTDGKTFVALPSRTIEPPTGAGDYGYWKPLRFECDSRANPGRWLRIEFQAQAQAARVEITYQHP